MFELAVHSCDESVHPENEDFFSGQVDFVASLDGAVQGHLSLFKLKCQTFFFFFLLLFFLSFQMVNEQSSGFGLMV